MPRAIFVLGVLLSLTATCFAVHAQPAGPQRSHDAGAAVDSGADRGLAATSNRPKSLRAALVGTPPFVIERGGEAVGMSVDIWRRVARLAELEYSFANKETVPEALDALENGEVDVVVGPVSVTANRIAKFEFTQPYYQSALAIVIPTRITGPLAFFAPFFTESFFNGLVVFLFILTVVGTLVWLAERRVNTEQFPPEAHKGIGHGLWFALVTMTSVGYGDKAPVTTTGRVLSGIWMLFAMITASSLTAFIATAFTVARLEHSDIAHANDLEGQTIATLQGVSSEVFARRHRARVVHGATVEDILRMVDRGEADAAVLDRPIAAHFLAQNSRMALSLLPGTYEPQGYAFATTRGAHKLRREIDGALLRLEADGAIDHIADLWLGE